MSEALSAGIRLIAIDLDHTLLTSDLTLSPADRSAMEHVASTGVQIALATGRMPRAALRYADLLPGLVHYIISYNGAITLNARRRAPIHAVPLDLASVWPVSNSLWDGATTWSSSLATMCVRPWRMVTTRSCATMSAGQARPSHRSTWLNS